MIITFGLSIFAALVIVDVIPATVEEIGEWEQCGGTSFKGNGVCRPGLGCHLQSQWYAQCRRECPSDWHCDKIKKKKANQNSTDVTNNDKILASTTTTRPRQFQIPNRNRNRTRVAKPANGRNFTITKAEFFNSVVVNGYPRPNMSQYYAFREKIQAEGGISTKREAAMFLAQIIWESGGLVHRREIDCKDSGCPGRYFAGVGYPGKNYYGRGYIQLTWDYNYRDASMSLFKDDRLLRDPDMVAENEELCWATALWFWKTRVGKLPEVKKGNFGSSTNAINGGLECGGPNEKARKRYDIYRNVLARFKIQETPIEKGCYN